MHELPMTKSIFRSVVTKAESVGATGVNRVVLEIGILRDFIPEIVQKYWDFIAPGSIAQGACIEIIELDAEAICGRCSTAYTITKAHLMDAHCPHCGYEYGTMIRGNELRIKGIEIVRESNPEYPKE